MIDKKAFRSLTYGMYLISSNDGDKLVGCVVNTFQQVTSEPPQVSVTINKQNATAEAIQKSGRFTASALSENATMELIGAFGFKSSRDIDKFVGIKYGMDQTGHPYVAEQMVAWFSARVIQTLDVGTHIIFVGEVEEAEVSSSEKPMSYSYYHQVKGGKTPPKAPSFEGDSSPVGSSSESSSTDSSAATPATANGTPQVAWRCTVCGYIEYMGELPDGYMCPLCGAGKEFFERIEVDPS